LHNFFLQRHEFFFSLLFRLSLPALTFSFLFSFSYSIQTSGPPQLEINAIFVRFLTSTFDLLNENRSSTLGHFNSYPCVFFLCTYEIDVQPDKQTGKTGNAAYIGRPHNKNYRVKSDQRQCNELLTRTRGSVRVVQAAICCRLIMSGYRFDSNVASSCCS